MRWRPALVLAGLLACAGPAAAQDGAAQKLVEDLYALHATAQAEGTPGPLTAEQRGRFFTDPLVALLEAEEARSAAGEARLTFDPLANGEPEGFERLEIETSYESDDSALVIAEFRTAAGWQKIVYDLVATPAGWRIDSLGSADYDAPWRLSTILEGPPG